MLDAWAGMLPEQTEGDRTACQRRARAENFVSDIRDEDEEALFARLEIRVTLRNAARSDAACVTELINRTDQFDLAGSRTTVGEISGWHEEADTTLFGRRGRRQVWTNGPHLDRRRAARRRGLSIPIFVLSCRVFGYGIETIMLEREATVTRSEERIRRFRFGRLLRDVSQRALANQCTPITGSAGMAAPGSSAAVR